MTKPKISVLIPTYNYARYLPEAIESVLKQDWQDLEVLISDDASTDESANVIARYAAIDNRIRVKIHLANMGMVENWNWCLSQARGEYIKYLFGDDVLASPRALSRFVESLESNPSAVLVVSSRYLINENSRIVDVGNDFKAFGFHSGSDAITRCMKRYKNLLGEPSVVMFRRFAAERGFDTAYRQGRIF
uniref:Glycosyl transferase family 2 n=1 Tax=Candidatus Kentrum sp. DK TaxID=2126562 RepID=A0A450T5L6_9GAMM|nr:MAG: Glycosyl transferase family 2 [Candidatus Kentron sp. DK]